MEAPTRTSVTLETARAVFILLAFGLAFRLILAHLLPGSGFENDLFAFRFWANNLAAEGLFGFYQRPFLHDYTPGYMYLLWVVGFVEDLSKSLLQALGPLAELPPFSLISIDEAGRTDLIKLPAILSDLVLAWLAWSMTRELGAGRRAGVLAAALVILNPITWFDSVVWGQVDSVGVIFLLLGVRELWRDRPERAAIYTVVGAVIKPQLGILVPIVAAVTIRRALWPEGRYGDDGDPGTERGAAEGRTTLAWERRTHGPIRILTTGAAGLLTAIALAAPFGLSIAGLIGQVATAAGGYPYLSVNAYNPWALLELDGSGIAANGAWVCDAVVTSSTGANDCPEAFMFGALPAVLVGTTLLLAAVVAISVLVARRPDRRTILVGVAVMAIAFFVLPTRVHERYLFPFHVVAVLLAAVSFRWRLAYVVLGLATFANMYVVLTTIYPGNPSIDDWLGIGPALRSWHGVAIAAALHLLGFLWAAWQLRADGLWRLGEEIEADAARASGGEPAPPAVQPAYRPDRRSGSVAPGAASVGLAAAASPRAAEPEAERYAPPVWRERVSLAEAGVTGWLRARMFDRPVRPDRTAALRGERGGRLDRLDVWVILVLVLAAMTLRMWRLAEPYRMHFDEVYHARTGAEFLQFWRYGIDDSIYEWTHPHLAKYAIAGGLVAFANDRVTATGELGVTVRDAVVEPRWEDTLHRGSRAGDRLHVATGSEVRTYDLRSRGLETSTPIAGAAAVALDSSNHRLFVGAADGSLLTIDLRALDDVRREGGPMPGAFTAATLDAGIVRLHVADNGGAVVAVVESGDVVTIDSETSEEIGRVTLEGVSAFADAGTAPALVAVPDEVVDPAAAAARLEALLGGDGAAYEERLRARLGRSVLTTVEGTGDARAALDEAIAAGELPGVTVDDVPRIAVGHGGGVTILSGIGGPVLQELEIEGGVQGMARVEVDDPALYVSNDHPEGPRFAIIRVGGDSARDRAFMGPNHPLPARGGWVGFDPASDQIHILGEPPAGRPADQAATVYVIEPHGESVYADAVLPFEPAAVALDVAEDFPSSDRQQLLALEADGSLAVVDAGQHAFGWRLPGVLAGVVMAVLMYLLARFLFARRSVAVAVAGLAVLDGMLFVQSRIAMNDAYVAVLILAAYTLFAGLWTGRWRRPWAFWTVLPVIGLLLGLALAAKWVAAYAIGALGILILARSALGRVVLILGLIAATTILGYMALSVPPDTPADAGWQLPGGFVIQGNLTFGLIMAALTFIAVVAAVVHPIAWSDDELRFAIGAPVAAAVAVALVALAVGVANAPITLGPLEATPIELAFALAVGGGVVAGMFWLAGRLGFGPLAPAPGPDDPAAILEPPAPPPEGWLRPGWLLGLPAAWMLACLLALPIAVYVASYLPWAQMQNHVIVDTAPRMVDGVEVMGWPWPKRGDTQTLLELTESMYRYHNNLSDAHAASSPWWAWPLDLKPVWFYQEFFAGGTAAAIYDAGTLAIWWLGIPAMGFVAWQAFRRRHLGLALIAIAFAAQWLSWARIDRAAFQYHYYTSLPFVILALGYFLAELWHGASRRTWLLARLAAAAAVIGPAVLWILHRPLCGLAGVSRVNEGSEACPTLIPELVLTQRTAGVAAVVGISVFLLVRRFLRLERPEPDAPPSVAIRALLPIALTAAGGLAALTAVTALLGEVELIKLSGVAVEPIAIVVLLPLLAVAAIVATARDARRFVLGFGAAAAAGFVILYPNISGLPLPSAIFNAYQGLLPTYLYPFQFAVSVIDRSGPGPALVSLETVMLAGALTVTSLILAYSAWVWRIALAERELEPEPAVDEGGPAYLGSGGR